MPKRKPAPTSKAALVPTCKRCGLRLRIDPKRGSKAQMLRRAKTADGYCVNCAVHDWLRNTYPPNVLLAESGPGALVHPDVREQFEDIMRAGRADALPDEIDWNRIVEFWELPFPEPIKPSATNPVRQADLDKIARGECRAFFPATPSPWNADLTIRSFEELDQIEAGLGDDLRSTINRDAARARREEAPGEEEPPRFRQRGLFDQTDAPERKAVEDHADEDSEA